MKSLLVPCMVSNTADTWCQLSSERRVRPHEAPCVALNPDMHITCSSASKYRRADSPLLTAHATRAMPSINALLMRNQMSTANNLPEGISSSCHATTTSLAPSNSSIRSVGGLRVVGVIFKARRSLNCSLLSRSIPAARTRVGSVPSKKLAVWKMRCWMSTVTAGLISCHTMLGVLKAHTPEPLAPPPRIRMWCPYEREAA
mmetsp:Transcript_20142/g.47044  ORF Transcript_20142/g.47044 Transcript_20142/m.47044 type:complete len:201 (-) Transcript_20142:1309-1911(-)